MTIPNFSPEGISSRLLREVQTTHPNTVLVFGCGMNPLPRLLAMRVPHSRIIGYDHNPDKIQEAIGCTEGYQQWFRERDVDVPVPLFTSQRPYEKFDVVTALSAVHENPEGIIREMIELTAPSGTIVVLDYDMRGMAAAEFFSRWGFTRGEERELAAIGHQEAHRMHTSFGLEDCVGIMEANSVITQYTEGKTEAGLARPNTLHFLYVGRRG